MPCHDYGQEEIYQKERTKKIHKLTRMLCETCDCLEDEGLFFGNVSEELDMWWEQHKEEDSTRKIFEARESKLLAARKKALAKISEKDRKLLGL